MSILCASLKKIKTVSKVVQLSALFSYPKLVIFEDTKTYRIIDVKVRNDEDPSSTELVFTTEYEILDSVLQDYLLWLVLKSGELLLVNLLSGLQIKISIGNYANCKIQRFQTVGDSLIMLSESGEYLKFPSNTTELNEKFVEGVKEITVSLEKSRIHCPNTGAMILNNLNGLNMYTDVGNICIQCPLTGINQVISTSKNIQDVLPWGTTIVLSDKSNMWIVDLTNCNIVFEFENTQSSYYPLASHSDAFYYLLWNEMEVHICHAWNASTPTENLNEDFNISSTKLSSQETLKSQMQNLVDAALSSAEPNEVYMELKKFFKIIKDYVFLIDIASKLCQHNLFYKSVLYPLQKSLFSTDDDQLKIIFNDLMVKVDLLEYINFRGNSTYDNFNIFDQNFKQLCVTFISKSDLDLASICWLKYSEINLKMTCNDILDILNAIPNNIKLGSLVIWLRNFVPPILDENPYFIDLFVRWSTQRVFLFEQSGYWPKIGLKFIDEIITVLEKSLKTVPLRPISMDDLDMLKDHIFYIIELKEKYKINMLLGEISSQSPNEVALIMLRRCYTEDLSAFIQEYLPSFATRNSFELDDTLRSYIESEAATCGGGIDSMRLKILLNAFRSPTGKLDCLLQVLKVLDVPWDNTILDLAIVSAASIAKDFTATDADRNIAQEIQKELNYAKVKVVLKKYNFPLICTDYTIVLHKLIESTNVDLNDLKVVTSVMTTYTNYANVLYINRCLRDCETRAALDYFKTLVYKEKRILLKTILTKFEQIINSSSSDTTLERNYLDFLKGSGLLNEIEVNSVENLYHLKNSYNIALSIDTMYNEKRCANLAVSWVNNDRISASSGRGRCVTQLTRAYQSRYSALIELLRRISTSDQVRNLIENLLVSLPTEENKSSDETVSVLSNFKDGCNSLVLLDSFNVLIEVASNCIEEHLHFVTNYLTLMNALVNANLVVKNLSVIWKFHYTFLPMSSVTATNNLIDLYINTTTSRNKHTNLVNTVNINDFIVFRILSHILEKSIISENTLCDDYYKIKDNASKKLISKVIASQDLDAVLLTNLLLIVSADNPLNETEDKVWILDLLQGQNDTLPLAVMGYLSSPVIRRTFALDGILPGSTISYPPQYILKSKFNINLTDIALPDSTEETWDVKVVLFYVLRQYPDTTFERLVELCRTLNVDVNDGLSLQLLSILTTWELKYKVYNDELGCRQLYFENNEKDLICKCFTIWESIDDRDFIRDILNDFWKNGEVTLHGRLISINPYYYEIYVCIYHLIYGSTLESRNKNEYFLLHFLKEYKRKSTPKQYEFELFSVKGMFPEIGHYRLPFHLFMRDDMWSNLKSEITLETYERWLPAVALLSLDADFQTAKDMICSTALKQTMTSRKRNEGTDEDLKENEPWRLTTREEPLLRAAHRCVRHISNMEWAGACLFYVLQGCARGADQVAAAHLCYQFAQRWAALQPGNRAVRQMERLHSTLSTRHALHKIDWAREEFIRLSSEPTQLIRALYLHTNFVEKIMRYDVNGAANEIADKNGINISSIRIQILENILGATEEENKNSNGCGLDIKRLITAKYILKATCPKMGAIYLSRIAFDDESDFDKCKKLRALQCLMSVVEPDTAMKVTNREREALWSSLLELLYIVNLENIDMPWIVATFMQDKIRALEQLLESNVTNIQGLKITADLARRFGNVKIFRGLIPLLLRAGLYEEMIPLLLKISSPPDDMMYTAWRSVILSPFQRADYPITERQKTKCLNSINLLPVCPVIKDEDLIEIWKHCIRCKCLGLGCLVLPYITPQKRQTINELKKIDRRTLIASLKNLHSETYLVPSAMFVVETMISNVYR